MSIEISIRDFVIHQSTARNLALSLCGPHACTGHGSGELALLCDLYGCDKGTLYCLSDRAYRWAPHTYNYVYEALLDEHRHTCRRVFECGIGTVKTKGRDQIPAGASLRVWRDYFPQAEIYGADIDPDCLFEETRIHTGVMDQTSPSSITAYFAPLSEKCFDFMIDDGLHTAAANLSLLESSLPYLAPHGIYAIEDIPPAELSALREGLVSYEEHYVVRYALLPTGFSTDNNLVIITPRTAS